jgi:hypothetical protein
MPPEGQDSAVPDPMAGGSGPGTTSSKEPLARRWLVAFGRFWWDFLVGDTPELLIGVLIALGIVALLVKGASLNALAVAGFPAMVAVMLGLSVYRARPKH